MQNPEPEVLPRVKIEKANKAFFGDGLIHLNAMLNGIPVILEIKPHDAITGIAAVQRALFGAVIPWPLPGPDH